MRRLRKCKNESRSLIKDPLKRSALSTLAASPSVFLPFVSPVVAMVPNKRYRTIYTISLGGDEDIGASTGGERRKRTESLITNCSLRNPQITTDQKPCTMGVIS